MYKLYKLHAGSSLTEAKSYKEKTPQFNGFFYKNSIKMCLYWCFIGSSDSRDVHQLPLSTLRSSAQCVFLGIAWEMDN